MTNLFFYTTVVVFALGVLFVSEYQVPFAFWYWGMFMGVVLGVIALRRYGHSPSRFVALCAVILSVFSFAALHTDNFQQQFMQSSLQNLVGSEVTLQGYIYREPETRARTTQIYVQTDGGKVLLYAVRYADVSYGDQVLVQGRLAQPQAFVTDTGRVFDYAQYLRARGVSYVMFEPQIDIQSTKGGNPLFVALYRFKDAFREKLALLLPAPEVYLGEGLLLGVPSLSERWQDIFRTSGIIHIVVLSGYNITIVILFVTYLLAYLLPYRVRLVCGAAAIFLFAALVGFSATVLRASIMAGILLLLKFTGNTYNLLRGLMIAGVLMVLFNPLLLRYDPGFQLSFLATLGLLLLAPHLENWFSYIPTFGGIREFFVATISTQLFVSPFLLYQIGQLSVVALAVNVLVLPFVPVAMLLTFLAGVLSFFFMPAAVVFGFLAQVALMYILRVAVLFAQLPFATFSVPAFPFWAMLLGYLLLGVWVYTLHTKKVRVPTLLGWTIEDEAMLGRRLKAASRSDAASVPIFFR